jgi:urease accessory protein
VAALSPLALVLADARTPMGSYAHSGGLEAAVADGLRADHVPAFMRGRLATVASVEAALSAAAVLAGGDLDELLALDEEALARCVSPVLRTASAALGRAVLRTGLQLFPAAPTLVAYRSVSAHTPRPVGFGAVAQVAGLDPADAALISLHEDAATVAAAAIKLLPVDAGAAASWVAALAPELERLSLEAAACALRDELPSLSAPLVELRSITDHGGMLFAS